MKMLKSFGLVFFCVCCGLVSIIGCPATTPTVTLTATDCPVDDISITATTVVTGSKPNFTVTVNVTVTCAGNALPNAELKVEWWFGTIVKITTDATGKATARRGNIWADPRGQKVTITIVGADDEEKTVEVTVQ